MTKIADVLDRLRNGQTQRLLAFGSSNTERCITGMHWFDCLDLALHQSINGPHRCINTGVCGNTTRSLLSRFDEDVARYEPDLCFITIGGNDCLPVNKLSLDAFRENLLALHRRLNEAGCAVVFQTYYAADLAQDAARRETFPQYMACVNEVAAETKAELIDHLARWEPLRLKRPDHYQSLMRDPMHVNEAGNLVLGLDVVRYFGLTVGEDRPEFWAGPRQTQQLMDELADG